MGDDKHFTKPVANGDVGCYVALSGNYGYLATAVGDKFELGAAPLPQEGPKKFVSLSEPVFAIAKTNPEEELASWMFLKYLLSPEVNAECGTVSVSYTHLDGLRLYYSHDQRRTRGFYPVHCVLNL